MPSAAVRVRINGADPGRSPAAGLVGTASPNISAAFPEAAPREMFSLLLITASILLSTYYVPGTVRTMHQIFTTAF